jgi:hypothetical protein
MPRLTVFEGIRINVYFGEHLPPHIHALYNEYEALLSIRDGKVFDGYLPGKQLLKARNWIGKNQTELIETFYSLNPHLKNEERNKKYSKNNKNKRC